MMVPFGERGDSVGAEVASSAAEVAVLLPTLLCSPCYDYNPIIRVH